MTSYKFSLAYFQVSQISRFAFKLRKFKLYLQNTLNILKTTRVYFRVLHQASHDQGHVIIVTSLDTLDEIALRGGDSGVMGHHSPNCQWDMRRRSLFLFTPAWARGTSVSPKVLHKHLLFHRRAIWARAWVEVEDRALRPELWRPRGVSTLRHHRLRLLIIRLYRVYLCYLAYGRGYYLILVHHIHYIVASCVNVLDLKVESLGKPLHVSSPLGIRVRVDQICRDCDLEISGILLTVDLRVMDISNFDVILVMD